MSLVLHTKIKEYVNVYKYPKRCFKLEAHCQITLGDLHGNAIKLLFMLIKQSIAFTSPKNYKQIVSIYTKPVDDLTETDLKIYNECLDEITFDKASIRLIGDELCDRGSNDYFTLKLIELLDIKGVELTIIVSNHSMDFLCAFEQLIIKGTTELIPPLLQKEHSASLQHLNVLLSSKLIQIKEIINIVMLCYIPKLKIIDIVENDGITFFSHAPVDIYIIDDLFKKFGILEIPNQNLIGKLDRINQYFQQCLKDYKLENIISKDKLKSGYRGVLISPQEFPLEFSIWNRNLTRSINRSRDYKDQKILYVHGHDSDIDPSLNHFVLNLDQDNLLGKGENSHEDYYVVLYSGSTLPFYEELQDHKSALSPLLYNPVDEVSFYNSIYMRPDSKKLAERESVNLFSEIKTKITELKNFCFKTSKKSSELIITEEIVASKFLFKIETCFKLTEPNLNQFFVEVHKIIAIFKPQLEQFSDWKECLHTLSVALESAIAYQNEVSLSPQNPQGLFSNTGSKNIADSAALPSSPTTKSGLR